MDGEEFQPGERDLGFWVGIVTKFLVPVLLLGFAAILATKLAPDLAVAQGEAMLVVLAVAVHVTLRIALDFKRGRHLAAARAERFPVTVRRMWSYGAIWLSVAIPVGSIAFIVTDPLAQTLLWLATALLALWSLLLFRRARWPITLGIAGFHDRRCAEETIPWQDIAEVREISERGGTFAVMLDLRPDRRGPRKLRIPVGDLAIQPDELIACLEHMRRRARGDGLRRGRA